MCLRLLEQKSRYLFASDRIWIAKKKINERWKLILPQNSKNYFLALVAVFVNVIIAI